MRILGKKILKMMLKIDNPIPVKTRLKELICLLEASSAQKFKTALVL